MSPSATKRLLPYITAWTDGKDVFATKEHHASLCILRLEQFERYGEDGYEFEIVEAKPEPKVIFVNSSISGGIDGYEVEEEARAVAKQSMSRWGKKFASIAVPYQEIVKDE